MGLTPTPTPTPSYPAATAPDLIHQAPCPLPIGPQVHLSPDLASFPSPFLQLLCSWMSPFLPLLLVHHALLMATSPSVLSPLGFTTQCLNLEIAFHSDSILCLHTPLSLGYLYLSQDVGLLL